MGCLIGQYYIQIYHDLFDNPLLSVGHLVVSSSLLWTVLWWAALFAHMVYLLPLSFTTEYLLCFSHGMFWYLTHAVIFIYLQPVHMTWTLLSPKAQFVSEVLSLSFFGRVSHFLWNAPKTFVHWTLFIVLISILYLVLTLYFY